MKARLSLSCVVALAGAGLFWGGGNAFGYAGERGTVAVGVMPLTVSTHHLHLTRALAYCAGLDGNTGITNPVDPLIDEADTTNVKEAERIAIYDELTDQGTIQQGQRKWTNITPTWSYVFPPPETATCRAEAGAVMVYPLTEPPPNSGLPPGAMWDPTQGWFTNRFGPWAVNFHFATDSDLQTMRAFAITPESSNQVLSARTVYAYGPEGSNMWTGTCYPPEYQTSLNTGMNAGSLKALGTYLHALGDSYSHGVCDDVWPEGYKPPWYYHTQEDTAQNVVGCEFNSHALEFGCPSSSLQAKFENNVVEGGAQVFNRLFDYARLHGKPERVHSADSYNKWLRRQLERYTTLFLTTDSDAGGACRVSFAWELMKACGAISPSTPGSACLDDVPVTCSSGGQVVGCNPDPGFISTPSCKQSTTATR